jgi:hypothetical protein
MTIALGWLLSVTLSLQLHIALAELWTQVLIILIPDEPRKGRWRRRELACRGNVRNSSIPPSPKPHQSATIKLIKVNVIVLACKKKKKNWYIYIYVAPKGCMGSSKETKYKRVNLLNALKVHDNTVRTQFHVCPQIRCNKIMHINVYINWCHI